MATNKIEFHKIWIDQCEATEGIKEDFGLQNALDYLIGEKVFSFVAAAEHDADFAGEIPAFLAEVRRIFTPQQICNYLDDLEHTKYLTPEEPGDETDFEEDGELEDENEYLEHPVLGAEELLRFARVKELLLAGV